MSGLNVAGCAPRDGRRRLFQGPDSAAERVHKPAASLDDDLMGQIFKARFERKRDQSVGERFGQGMTSLKVHGKLGLGGAKPVVEYHGPFTHNTRTLPSPHGHFQLGTGRGILRCRGVFERCRNGGCNPNMLPQDTVHLVNGHRILLNPVVRTHDRF